MRRQGVTVVETLVCVAITAVLVAVGYPAARAMMGSSQHSACAEKLHTLGNALTLYANDHDGYVPPATTAEFMYKSDKEIPVDEIEGSPALLRAVMKPYVPSDDAWFCPVDPHARENVVWLGIRHRLTSYFFFPKSSPDDNAWPPKMQLGRERLPSEPKTGEGIPLIGDACGVPSKDSDPQFRADTKPTSNHPDGMVNAIRQDLSLTRRPASYWMGTKE